MSDPCDSRRSSQSRRAAGAECVRVIEVETDCHAGDWSWLTALPSIVDRTSAAVAAGVAADTNLTADLALSDDAAVCVLNRDWRGQDKPTNVLSFPSPAIPVADGGPRFLGDIVIAEETLLAEAAAAGIPPIHHFQHLLVHGLLHLLGYDHEVDAEAEIMERLETEILAALGVSDPYAGTEAVAGSH